LELEYVWRLFHQQLHLQLHRFQRRVLDFDHLQVYLLASEVDFRAVQHYLPGVVYPSFP